MNESEPGTSERGAVPALRFGVHYSSPDIQPGSIGAAIADAHAAAARDVAKHGADLGNTVAMVRDAHREVDSLRGATFRDALQAGERVPVCAEGCFYCCHVQVAAAIPEVIALADHIETSGRRDDVLAAIARYLEQLGDRMGTARVVANVACPLLRDGRCSVYDHRPLSCRGHSSFDVAPCERAWRQPGFDIVVDSFGGWRHPSLGAVVGLSAASGALGLEYFTVYLPEALRIALELGADEANRRWRAGERVFEGARVGVA